MEKRIQQQKTEPFFTQETKEKKKERMLGYGVSLNLISKEEKEPWMGGRKHDLRNI